MEGRLHAAERRSQRPGGHHGRRDHVDMQNRSADSNPEQSLQPHPGRRSQLEPFPVVRDDPYRKSRHDGSGRLHQQDRQRRKLLFQLFPRVHLPKWIQHRHDRFLFGDFGGQPLHLSVPDNPYRGDERGLPEQPHHGGRNEPQGAHGAHDVHLRQFAGVENLATGSEIGAERPAVRPDLPEPVVHGQVESPGERHDAGGPGASTGENLFQHRRQHHPTLPARLRRHGDGRRGHGGRSRRGSQRDDLYFRRIVHHGSDPEEQLGDPHGVGPQAAFAHRDAVHRRRRRGHHGRHHAGTEGPAGRPAASRGAE